MKFLGFVMAVLLSISLMWLAFMSDDATFLAWGRPVVKFLGTVATALTVAWLYTAVEDM